MPAPKAPEKLAELTRIATKMEGMYGAGSYCKVAGDSKSCRQLGELEDVLRSNRDYDAQLDAWQGWHTIAVPMKKDYQRFVELSNEGARDLGFANTGELWRSGYDMSPAELAAESDRLWDQVKPLYEQLHCYARGKLDATPEVVTFAETLEDVGITSLTTFDRRTPRQVPIEPADRETAHAHGDTPPPAIDPETGRPG